MPGLKAKRRAAVIARRKGGVSIDMSLLGVPQYQKKINELKRGVAKKIVKQALRQAAKRLLKPEIDTNIAQVSPGKGGTGRLRQARTIVRDRKFRKGSSNFGVEVRTPTREKLDIKPGDAYYPALLEYGSATIGITPRRMLRGARETKQSAIITFLRRTMGKFIDAEVRKLRAKGKDPTRRTPFTGDIGNKFTRVSRFGRGSIKVR
jgi:hypothetical protein